jgi:hypothetical protein
MRKCTDSEWSYYFNNFIINKEKIYEGGGRLALAQVN